MRRLLATVAALATILVAASVAQALSPAPPRNGDVRDVRIHVDSAGPAFVTWTRLVKGETTSRYEGRAVAVDRDGAWTWADPVNEPAAPPEVPGAPYAAQRSTDPAGNELAIWVGDPVIRTAARPAGGVYGPVQALGSSASALNGPLAAIALGASGHAVALWQSTANDPERPYVTRRFVQAADRTPNGTWSPEYTLAGPDAWHETPKTACMGCAGPHIFRPAVAVDAAGNAVAAWVTFEAEGAEPVIKWAARPAGGAWSAPATIGPAGDGLQLTVDAAGTALLTWIDGSLHAAVRPAGGDFGAAEVLGPADWGLFGSHTTPSVTFDRTGRAHAVWGADRQVLAAARPAGGAWSEPIDLSKVAENPPPLISDVRLSRRTVRAGATALSFRMRAAGNVLVTVRRRGRGPAVRGVRTRAARGLNRVVLLARPLPPGVYTVSVRARAKDWAPASRAKRLLVVPPA